MRWCSRLAGAIVVLLSFAHVTTAQPATAPSAEAIDAAARLRIYLLTMGPGPAVWERFGHNAIEIVDPARDTDIACNWGVFDFFESGFYKRFIFGQMLYRMEVADAPRTVAFYRAENRSVYRQELNLTPRQKAVLYQYVAWNSRDENRDYRYDYYRDNCSTRVRDVIDRAAGGDLATQLRPKDADVSYRWHTRRIMAADVPMYTALLFILGHPVDRPISAWEESFLPLQLMKHLRMATITDDSGARVPLIKSEETLFEATRPPQRSGPPNWLIPFATLGLACAALFHWLARRGTRSRGARITFITLATIWSAFVGFAGSFALWGWTSTEHVSVYRNENILHFFPPLILLAGLLPIAYRRGRAVKTTRWIAAGTVAASVIGLLLKTLPSFRQVNYELIAWVLPTHAAFAWGVWKLLPAPAPAPEVTQHDTASS